MTQKTQKTTRKAPQTLPRAASPEQAGAAATVADPRWRALSERRAAADGTFVYAVRTTGVYCRPSCPSRRPKPQNVRFFASAEQAERAAFRPCQRCRPQQPADGAAADRQTALIEAACRLIEAADSPPPLARLAAEVGLSPFHFHRLFRKTVGVTPKAYAGACRQRRLQQELQTRTSVADALYQAGFNASSRLYEQSDGLLGMTPGDYRSGAPGVAIRYAGADTGLGRVVVAVTARGVCAVEFGEPGLDPARQLRARFPQAQLSADPRGLGALLAEVVATIETPGRAHALPLDIQGTAFQRRVWQALRAIPPGETASYADIARRIGQPRAARAVANACAANRLAVLIPCHRVVRGDGAAGGYRWGEQRKQALLAREADGEDGYVRDDER